MDSKQQPAGSLDQTFGESGKVIFPNEEEQFVAASAKRLKNGAIIAVGIAQASLIRVVGFLDTGKVDTSYANKGVLDIGLFPEKPIGAIRWALLNDDSVVIAAQFLIENIEKVVLVHVLCGGVRDLKFGNGGIANVPEMSGVRVKSLGTNRNRIIIVYDKMRNQNVIKTELMKFDYRGQIDKGFIRITSQRVGDFYNTFLIRRDGKIILAGSLHRSPKAVIARYRFDGKIDSDFGVEGFLEVWIEAPKKLKASCLALQADGKFLVAGAVSGSEFPQGFICRISTDGQVDTDFNEGSVRLIDGVTSVAATEVQADGKIVVLGSSNGIDGILMRLQPSGDVDDSFGEHGAVDIDFEGGVDILSALTIQADGKLLISGASVIDGKNKLAMARFNA